MIVIDASVAVKWVLDEADSDAALRLRSEQLSAPSLWLIEAGNALWSRARRREISFTDAEDRLRILRSSPIVSTPVEHDLSAALKLANELAHPIYDCLYLALALREETHVVTADRRFAALAAARPDLGGRIRLLA